MRVEKGKVRAPEIGRVWLNSAPLSFRQLRGRAVLVDFWDYTCVNCIRTLPYVQAWYERYRSKGLAVIGVHTPEFTFAQYESNVESGVREFGLTYPIVIDSNREIWKAFANRYWPTKYLLDKDSYLRYGHFGEGNYAGAVCYRPTGELYLGHRRGRIGNEGGFKEDQTADYSFSPASFPAKMEENFFYASGRWASTAEYFEAADSGPHSLRLKFDASAVNLVMAAPRRTAAEVVILQDGKALTREQATRDTRFRPSTVAGEEESYVVIDSARMYFLLDNHDYASRDLELRCSPGVAAFAFTFTSCIDPVASAVQTTSSSQTS